DLVRRGLGPQSALAVIEGLHQASSEALQMEPGLGQALHPALDAYRRQFILSYQQARVAEILLEHGRMHQSMHAALEKQIASERLLQADLQSQQNQLQTAAEIVSVTTSILDLNELLHTAVDLICKRFALYYVGAFLVDEYRQWAILRAGTGDAGQ